mmetsp:Transcript_13074/g.15094  ORF Transcript_13074/g.15094 Transcript_13074/m.15094 type:complete len:152 (+) Transcript_13074:149-604(+)
MDFDSIAYENNKLKFNIRRDYRDFIRKQAEDTDIDVTLQVTCSRIFTSQDISEKWNNEEESKNEVNSAYQSSNFGVFNILIEEVDNKRLRVRDVPGVLDDSVFKKQQIIEDPAFEYSFSEEFLYVNFVTTEIEVCGFEEGHYFDKTTEFEL